MAEKKRFELPNKTKYRNLTQYRDLTEDEFEDAWARIVSDTVPSVQLEKRIEIKLKEFSRDYDISDLKINDTLTLRALIQNFIQLEDMEQALFKLREAGISPGNIAMIREINNVMAMLRKDISQMQEDLRITRKLRKGDKEQTVINYLEDLKTKAKKFYESTMGYIFCPECNLLLSTIWFQYPEGENTITLKCNRILDTGSKCKGKVEITSKELLELRNKNSQNVPEELF